jgi:transcriptional regulator with PAS, ATPase and Fis domain
LSIDTVHHERDNERMEIGKEARAVFDSMREGILIIDKQGVILFANKPYTRFVNKERGEANLDARIEGNRLHDLRPNARLLSVVKTGRAMMHTPRKEEKDLYFVNMYPVLVDGKVEAGLSVVTFVEDAGAFRTELENYENRARQVIRRINNASGARHTFDSIVARDPVSIESKALALKIARADATVLLQSESGTGKELYAQAIHNASPRSSNVFVAVNCANFSAEMLESELFGYEEGSFTGAKKGGTIGLMEAANHGTVF